MIILDTNVISEIMKSQVSLAVRDWVAKQVPDNLFVTVITQAEILYGIELLSVGKRQNKLKSKAQLIFSENFAGRILPFDREAAVTFAIIAAKRRRMGMPISQADAQIASICYIYQATLATRNVSDFEECNITVINPWDSI